MHAQPAETAACHCHKLAELSVATQRSSEMSRIRLNLFCLIAATCIGAVSGLAQLNAQSTGQRVEVADGASLRVVEAGRSGAGPALVFIPGWSTGADIWRRQIDAFAKTHRVIAIDPRSQGESTKTTTGNTPEMRAQDLHTLLEHVGVRHAVLIGWSQGVQDVAAYVERYGTKDLAGIVLVDAAVSDGADGWALVRNKRQSSSRCSRFIRRISRSFCAA